MARSVRATGASRIRDGAPARPASGALTPDALRARLVEARPRAVPARPEGQLPEGAPPRAGILTRAGELIVWRDGRPVRLVHLPAASAHRAMRSRHGFVLLVSDQTVLVRDDGEIELLTTGTLRGALDGAGELMAVVESHFGRRARHRLHLINLADGTRDSADVDDVAPLGVVGVHDGTVYLRTARWVPGRDPEPLPYTAVHLDPYTGTLLAEDGDASILVEPGGAVRPIARVPSAALAPGARRLYTFTRNPLGIALTDIGPAATVTAGGGTGEGARVHRLPQGADVATSMPGGLVWEDHDHLLLTVRRGPGWPGTPLVRLDVGTGGLEGIPLPAQWQHAPRLVEPLAREDAG